MAKENRDEALKRAGEVAKDIIAELDHFEVDYQSSIPTTKPPTTRDRIAVTESSIKSHNIVAQNMRELKKEPFIAYAKCLRNGKEIYFLFCRNYTPPTNQAPLKVNSLFVSYKAPIGQVASLDLGQQIPVNGRYIKVLEKTIFKPVFDKKWDGTDNQFNLLKEDISAESLRKLIELFTESKIEKQDTVATADQRDLLMKLIRSRSFTSEERNKTEKWLETPKATAEQVSLLIDKARHRIATNYQDELDEEEALKAYKEAEELGKLRELERARQQRNRRAIRRKLELIDRPVLDQHQDKIFRLSLRSQIILTGAPGTGKTTALVKRISQKSREEFLSDEEKRGLGEFTNREEIANQWIMFAPSDLLKIYLKEAMNKEGIAESNIVTWETTQTRLAREGVLDFLKVAANSKGLFRLGRDEILARTQNRQLIQYTKRFETYVTETVWKTCREIMRTLRTNKTSPELLNQLKRITDKYSQKILANIDKQVDFVDELARLQNIFEKLREDLKKDMEKLTDKVIKRKGVLNAVVELLEKEATLETPQMTAEDEDEDEGESLEAFEEIEEISSWGRRSTKQYQRGHAVNRIKLAIAWYVEWLARDRKSTESKKYWPVIQCVQSVLGNQGVEMAFGDEKTLVELGKRHLDLRSISPLTKGHEILLDQIPAYYNRFRRMLLREKSAYLKTDRATDIRENKLSRSEVDLLIFIMLKNARSIFKRHSDLLFDNTWLSNQILEKIRAEYRVQVLVDEATDFSSLQLGCMFFLSHPRFNSFVLSGDLMQRVTNHGLADWQECNLFLKKLEKHTLDKSYRQSARLLQIAKRLYVQTMKTPAPFETSYNKNENAPPPLQFNAKQNRDALAEWLAERISEIYRIHENHLPSIAIFVPEESDIEPLYDILVEPLNSRAFELDKCIDGKFGDGEKVRIFSVKYIKGLEFQGAFLVDVDKIQRNNPNLVDKYLYVGLTRAAEFLGITYNGRFPSRLSAVQEEFHTSDWNDYISV